MTGTIKGPEQYLSETNGTVKGTERYDLKTNTAAAYFKLIARPAPPLGMQNGS